jgi:carbonic anhydrase/acetyltransferase-like protein (isoleucine patch superfamily)
MPIFSFEGVSPQIHPSAFIAPTATIVGDVHIEANASVWYGAVLRGDYSVIFVREGANIQDGAVVHAPPDLKADIGPGVTVAHNCVIHGALLEEECLIANGAVVLDAARVGARSLVAAGSLVAGRQKIPAGVLAMGRPAEVIRELAGTPTAVWVERNPAGYRALAARHRDGIAEIER